MIKSPLDPVTLYDKLEKERAENDKLREEIADLKQKLEAYEAIVDCLYEAVDGLEDRLVNEVYNE
jgi:cell division septum initiation protein DivIVA